MLAAGQFYPYSPNPEDIWDGFQKDRDNYFFIDVQARGSYPVWGQTFGIEPTNGVIVSPANGTIEMFYETGHAFAIRTNNERGILVHIGINTVELKGKAEM